MNLKNSMLLANFMSQKQEIMYATIKGTLTENDGVFSGFSTSNYLKSQDTININNYNNINIKIRFKTPTNPNLNTHHPIFSIGNFTIANGISAYMGSSLMFMSVFDNVDYSVNRALNYDTWYIIDVNVDIISSKVNYIIYNDDKTKKTEYSGNKIPNIEDFFFFGKTNTNNTIQAIDLNNSYIKLGSTKYNLQAVVGYTIVGSPTIVDGVVSGFSGSDYLIIPIATEISFDTDVDFYFKLTADDQATTQYYTRFQQRTTQATRNTGLGVSVAGGTRRWVLNLYETNDTAHLKYSTSSYSVADNTTYYVHFHWDNKNKNAKIDISNDGVEYTNVITENMPNGIAPILTTNFWLGRYNSSIFWGGNIDLNNTYIKINNKLWFNGQPA